MSKSNKHKLKYKLKHTEFTELTQEEIMKTCNNRGKKFKATPGRGLGISKTGKLVAKNTNRSVIKKQRQLNKIEIQKEI